MAWALHDGHEYIIVGDGISIDMPRLEALVESTFASPKLCFSLGRRTALTVERSEAAAWISQRALLKKGSTVADESLSVFLQVLAIGVARTGVAQAG